MNIYEIDVFGNLEYVRIDEQFDSTKYLFDGAPKCGSWAPDPGVLVTDFGPANVLRPGDMLDLSGCGVPVLNDVAVSAVGEWLRTYGELLPQPCSNTDDNWWIFNPTTLIDALDIDNSTIKRWPEGNLRRVEEFAFFEDRIGDVEVFKLSAAPLGGPFITEAGVERLEASGIRIGVNFRLKWNGAVVPRTRRDVFRYRPDAFRELAPDPSIFTSPISPHRPPIV